MKSGHKVSRRIRLWSDKSPWTKVSRRFAALSKTGAGRSIAQRWRRLGLTGQFLATSLLLAVVGMVVISSLQARWITSRLLDSTIENATIYMEGIVAPLVRDVPPDADLSDERRALLDATIQSTGLIGKVLRVNIWRPDGRFIYGSDGTGAHHAPDMEDFDGNVSYEIETGGEGSDGPEAASEILEIYIPIRDIDGELVAIGEFYQDLAPFHDRILEIILGSWLIRLCVFGVVLCALLLIVHRAARTISLQRADLTESRRRHLSLMWQNRRLARQSEQAKRLALENSEKLLSRIGADIHDGPTQLIALAILNVGRIGRSAGDEDLAILAKTQELLQHSITELRQMSSGLILPEIDGLSAEDVVRAAVDRHERQSGTRAALVFEGEPVKCGVDLQICMYRITQEGLNNASRHAPMARQTVVVTNDGTTVSLRVSDSGAGPIAPASDPNTGLGLIGLRNRVKTFGGSIRLVKATDGTTLLEAFLPLKGKKS